MIARWKLNYGWDNRHWSTRTDVALEARLSGPGVEQARRLAHDWIRSFAQGRFLLDGKPATIWYEGGVRAYLDDQSIWLHSSGEDAFDTLHYYATLLADRLDSDCRATPQVTWVEHAHRRTHHRLTGAD